MQSAPIPDSEAERLAALRRYGLLDTGREPEFDDFTSLARLVCDTPIAFITLLSEHRQWFKSELGFGVRETPRELAFCAHTILADEVMVVPDALLDRRFADNPLVLGAPRIRFYAGAPLITPDGHRIGTLSVVDHEPRQLDEPRISALQGLARKVIQVMELRVAKQRLEHQARLFEHAMHVTSVAPWEHDLERDVFHFNDRMFALLGTDAEREGGYDLPAEIFRREFAHPEDEAIRDLSLEKARQTDDPDFVDRIQHRITRRDGEVRMLEVSYGVVKDGSGRTVATRGASQDVTDSTLLERRLRDLNQELEQRVVERTAELREAEKRTRTILDHLAEGVIACDAEANLILFNRTAQVWHGLDAVETTPEKWAERYSLFEGDGTTPLATERNPLMRAYRGETVRGADVCIAPPGLPKRFLLVNGGPVHDAEERMLGAVVVLHDVSARRRAEREARTALATLEAASDGAMMLLFDTLEVRYANRAAGRGAGLARSELIGRTAFELIPDLDNDEFHELLRRMRAGEERSRRLVTGYQRPDGTRTTLELGLTYVAPSPHGPAQLIAVIRDISRRLARERETNRAQRLQSIGTLASGIAHDLNNAIAPILMGVDLLREQFPGESDLLEVFDTSARRAADMVRQLVTFATGAEGDRVEVSPAALLDEAAKLIRSTFPKNVELRVRCDPDLPAVLGDATQLHQLLVNLCVNARDAMPRGGTLTLGARLREIDPEEAREGDEIVAGTFVELSVQDTGSGIPPDVLDRIFDPFFTTKGPNEGTGLGLSTCRGLVRGHGGFLRVETAVSKGTTFSAFIPVAPEGDVAVIGDVPEPAFRGNGELVLVVDDEGPVRQMASRILARLGLTPIVAGDGAEALVQVADHRDSLRAVITDLHMPHMDGMTFIENLRRMLPQVDVIVSTGRFDEPTLRALRDLEVEHRLDKPFRQSQLVEMLARLFGDHDAS